MTMNYIYTTYQIDQWLRVAVDVEVRRSELSSAAADAVNCRANDALKII